jgi:phosphopantothenoylcysteine synthetase/decarboxylase
MQNPQDLVEMAKKKIEEIQRALQEGRRVYLGHTKIESIEIVPSITRRSYVVIINGKRVLYLSNFIRHEVKIE